MPTKKKKVKQSRKRGFCVFAFGAKSMQGLSRRGIQASLLRAAKSIEETLSYVVMGNVRETEKVIYSICRKNHLPVAIIPADFEKWGGSAEYLRNGLALKFFKPSVVVMAYTEEKAEEETVALSIIKWARAAQVPVVFCGSKKEGSK